VLPPPPAPSFPATAAFIAEPTSREMPSTPPIQQPFDAGSSTDANSPDDTATPSFLSPPDPFEGHLDFSANPLPRPEALMLREAEEPIKKARFGRKKLVPATSESVVPDPFAPATPAIAAPSEAQEKKAKRFGKKSVPTVDLLGSPLSAARVLDRPVPGMAESDPIIKSDGMDIHREEKPKRKIFAKVDRSKETPLTPTTGRARKMVQGLAAVSLLAGAGLFAVSFLDKKTTASVPTLPANPVSSAATSVPPATASSIDPSVSVPAIVPIPVDPATGLPQPTLSDPQAAEGEPTVPVATPTSVAGIETNTNTPPDTSGVPAVEAPTATITPGPDDLEFTSGGDFSGG
jgi:hypothetical protein